MRVHCRHSPSKPHQAAPHRNTSGPCPCWKDPVARSPHLVWLLCGRSASNVYFHFAAPTSLAGFGAGRSTRRPFQAGPGQGRGGDHPWSKRHPTHPGWTTHRGHTTTWRTAKPDPVIWPERSSAALHSEDGGRPTPNVCSGFCSRDGPQGPTATMGPEARGVASIQGPLVRGFRVHSQRRSENTGAGSS